MELVISDNVAHKIWNKNNRRISRDDAQRAWATFIISNGLMYPAILDTRDDQDPPLQWILVKINRKLLKLVFSSYEDDDIYVAYLATAYYVERKARIAYEREGGIIYG